MTRGLLIATLTGCVCTTLVSRILERTLGMMATLVAVETLWIVAVGMYPALAVGPAVARVR